MQQDLDVPKLTLDSPNIPGMTWCTIDASLEEQLAELHAFLAQHYVASEAMAFQYSLEFLRWALNSPRSLQAWHVGLRSQKSGKLMAFIMGLPTKMRRAGHDHPSAAINFLAIHTKLRNRRLAVVMIQEVTRRIDAHGYFQAMYTSGTVLPRPVCTCRYHHRPLNYAKCIKSGFCALRPRQTVARMHKLYALPDTPPLALTPLVEADIPSVSALLRARQEDLELHLAWDEEETAHFMLSRPNILESYVLRDEASGACTDVCSFFHVPARMSDGTVLHIAFAWYSVATSVTFEALMQSCLVLAKQKGADVFNALEIMDNAPIFQRLKFDRGTGTLNYYLYNMPCSAISASKLGILLL